MEAQHTTTLDRAGAGKSRAAAEAVKNTMQTKLEISQPGDMYEREADATADRVMSMPEPRVSRQPEEEEETVQAKTENANAGPWIQRKGEEEEEMAQPKMEQGGTRTSASWLEQELKSVQSGGEGLPATTAMSMGQRFGADFSDVRVHNDSSSHSLNRSLGSQAFTYGGNLFFNEGRYQPGTPSGDHLLAHELTHVVQQGGAKTGGVQTALADVNEADRRQMIHSFVPVPPSLAQQLQGFFATDPAHAGGATESHPLTAEFTFSDNIPEESSVEGFNARHGLSNVAGWLVNATNILPLNTVVSVQLDIQQYGGTNGIYRFSYYDTGSGDSLVRHMDIELRSITTAAAPQVDMPEGSEFQVHGATFRLGSGWSQEQFNILMQALNLIPQSVLTAVAGITFERSGNVQDQAEAGHYDMDAHSITVRSSAFDPSLARYGSYTEATRVISHEVGHALDYAALRTAWTAYEGSGNAQALERTRTSSGLRYSLNEEDNIFEITESADSNAFRRAVEADRAQTGGRSMPQSITTYGATNWEENYAEAFSMYITDPETFRLLRPNTYRYFQQNL